MKIQISPIISRINNKFYNFNSTLETNPFFVPNFKGLEKDTLELQSDKVEKIDNNTYFQNVAKESFVSWSEAKKRLLDSGFKKEISNFILNKISEVQDKTELSMDCCDEGNIIPNSVVDNIIELAKNADSTIIQKLVTYSYNENLKKFNKAIFNTNKKLFELGIPIENIDLINDSLAHNKFNYSDEVLEKMLSNLPDIEDKTLLGFFIEYRNYAAKIHNSQNNNEVIFSEDLYELFNKIFASGKHWQNAESLYNAATVIYHRNSYYMNRQEVSKPKFRETFNYLVNNFENPNLPYVLNIMNDYSLTIVDPEVQLLLNYANLGANKEYLSDTFNTDGDYPFNKLSSVKQKERLKKFQDLKNDGVHQEFILPIIEKKHTDEEIKLLSDIANSAMEKRDKLGSADEPVSNAEIIDILYPDKYSINNLLDTVKLLGKNSFIALFDDGANKVENYVLNFGNTLKYEYIQPLLKLINPAECDEVKNLERQIKELKQELQSITDDNERKKQFVKINTLTKQRNDIFDNSIKDPAQKIKVASIYKGLVNDMGKKESDYKNANNFIPYINPKTDEEKQIYVKKLNDYVWASMNISCPNEIKNRFDFSTNPYLENMFQSSVDFDKGLKKIINVLIKYPEMSVSDVMATLPQNKKTEKIFKEHNLNFQKWIECNPELKYEFSYSSDGEKLKSNAIKNLESDFNDKFFASLPKDEQSKMIKAINNGGYQLVKTKKAKYDEDGYLEDTVESFSLLKNNKNIEFKDLSKVIKILSDYMNNSDFWKYDSYDENIEENKETFRAHFSSRCNELKSARQFSGVEDIHLSIQKVDMNDISHSLFLGNDSSCCTAVGSVNDWSAPEYIMNKVVQCIEIKDGDKSIGNTMIYPILVKGKPALLLDNIELKPKYQYNENVEKGICEFAKIFAKEVGINPQNIYAGPNRHKLDMKNFSLVNAKYTILGATGKNESVYLDSVSDSVRLTGKKEDNTFNDELYKFKKTTSIVDSFLSKLNFFN